MKICKVTTASVRFDKTLMGRKESNKKKNPQLSFSLVKFVLKLEIAYLSQICAEY